MRNHKLLLNDFVEEQFSLLAIHCSEEAYKLAYLLNKHLKIHLQRKRIDLDYSENGAQTSFPIFEFEDTLQYTCYYLVGNKSKLQPPAIFSSTGLFSETETNLRFNLLPEFKNIDYFLKIESDFDSIPVRKTVSQINEIKEIISAYIVDKQNIKTHNHLIFH